MPGPVDTLTLKGRIDPPNRSVRDVQPSKGALQPDKLEQACRDFESIFIGQMMQQMRQTVPQDGLFSGGRAEQIYTSMMDDEMAKSIAQQRGLGLAEVLYRQLATVSDIKE